jgi:sugar/nucleoside kinase (ribokinase family)
VNEIGPDVVRIFDEQTLVVAVPQGWMRRWDDTGRVYSKPWDSAPDILPYLDVLVLSLEDIDYDVSRLAPALEQVPLVVLTEYHDGSTIYRRLENGAVEEIKIAPRPAAEFDPTGAGDVFATAFMIRLQETGDPVQSARFANVTASFSVEHPGVSGIPSREQVLAYMAKHPFVPVA